MMELSKTLKAKAIELHSTTIPSPTGRVSKTEKLEDGTPKPITPTLYFDKPATVKDDNGKDKLVPSQKSTLYTPNAIEAAELKANVDIVETVKLNGKQFRFLKSTLTESEKKEIVTIKGMLRANDLILKIKAAVKVATSAYIMSLDKDSRDMVANAMANVVSPALEILRNGKADDEKPQPLFS